MLRLAVLGALAAALSVSAAGATVTPSGLRGLVVRGPIAPVCAKGQACSAPAKNVTLAFMHKGATLRKTKTNDQGRYRILLPPGVYSVRLVVNETLQRRLEPEQARVAAGRVRRTDFSIDTGIR